MDCYHRCIKLPWNDINGTTTTVVPVLILRAGNMNNKLFPAPVPMMTNMGVLFFIMACNTSSCSLRNLAPSPTSAPIASGCRRFAIASTRSIAYLASPPQMCIASTSLQYLYPYYNAPTQICQKLMSHVAHLLELFSIANDTIDTLYILLIYIILKYILIYLI